MARLRKAAKTTAVAQAFNWLGLMLSLATVPLYLRWLGQERYGVLLTGLAFAGYLMFSDAGINWASMLLIAQANGRDDRETIAAIVRNSFSLAVCSAAVVILGVALLQWVSRRPQAIVWMPKHPEFPGLLIAIGASVVCSLALSPFYNLFVGLQEAHLAAAYQGSGRLLGTAAAVAIAATHAPLGWVFGGNAGGAFLAGILAAVHCRRRHPWAFRLGPMWEAHQIQQQLRTGAKSLVMQVGNVLWGTAPVLAISSGAGAQFVPYFSIPMTLLNAPLGILSSFSASLQPGYGEAMGRGEVRWVAETVQRIFRQVLVVLGLLGCGFLLLAVPFVRLWTGGRIELPPMMLSGVLAVGFATAVLTVFRFAITGINRHRHASVSDLVGGILAMVLAMLVARQWGYQFVPFAVVVAAVLTSGWILPGELRRALDGEPLLPSPDFFLRLGVNVAATFTAGWLMMQCLAYLPIGIWIVLTGMLCTTSFLVLGWLLLPREMSLLRSFLPVRFRGKMTRIIDNPT